MFCIRKWSEQDLRTYRRDSRADGSLRNAKLTRRRSEVEGRMTKLIHSTQFIQTDQQRRMSEYTRRMSGGKYGISGGVASSLAGSGVIKTAFATVPEKIDNGNPSGCPYREKMMIFFEKNTKTRKTDHFHFFLILHLQSCLN